MVLSDLSLPGGDGAEGDGFLRTRDVKRAISAFGVDAHSPAVLVDGIAAFDESDVGSEFALAARNLQYVCTLPQIGLNVLDILRHEWLFITADALTALQARLLQADE